MLRGDAHILNSRRAEPDVHTIYAQFIDCLWRSSLCQSGRCDLEQGFLVNCSTAALVASASTYSWYTVRVAEWHFHYRLSQNRHLERHPRKLASVILAFWRHSHSSESRGTESYHGLTIWHFWAIVTSTGSPYATGPLSCLSVCLSVCNVAVLWQNGWIKTSLGTKYRPRPRRHCVRPVPFSRCSKTQLKACCLVLLDIPTGTLFPKSSEFAVSSNYPTDSDNRVRQCVQKLVLLWLSHSSIIN